MNNRTVAVIISLLCIIVLCGCSETAKNARVTELTLTVDDETIAGLDEYPDLEALDLSGSTCYDAIEEYIASHPQVDITYTVDIGGGTVDSRCTFIDLNDVPYELAGLQKASPYLHDVKSIRLPDTGSDTYEIYGIKEMFPEAQLTYSVAALGGVYPMDTQSLDLGDICYDDTEMVCALAGLLPELGHIDLTSDDGSCALDSLDEIIELKERLPEGISLDCSFELFGQTVSSADEEIQYFRQPIGDEGIDTLRRALPLLTSCGRFLLDDCDMDYELLSGLRDEFPQSNIVWRVHFGVDSALTDATTIWTMALTNSNCHVLNYCNKVKYFDVGHTQWLSDISYFEYMPDLEVVIIALTAVSDLTPLRSCEKLEYLEIFGSKVTDVSPLAELHNLQHLNMSTLLVRDISPLYGLTNLKRLRIVLDIVPDAQKKEIAEKLPDCEMMFSGDNPTGSGWRRSKGNDYTERYALLREQIGYGDYYSPRDLIDVEYVLSMHYTNDMVFTRS